MRVLILGDVIGRTGRQAIGRHLPHLKGRLKPDLVIVNGENAAGGFGITEAIYDELREYGADVVTLGNHAFRQREAFGFIDRADALVRPLNFPPSTPGRGAVMVQTSDGQSVLIINALGCVFMDALDDPFAALDKTVAECPLSEMCDAIIVDFHAEASSEKQAIGAYLDGRVSVVFGTHTHVPTADYRIQPGGTAFVSDIGMTGAYNSVIGMDKQEPVNRFVTKIPSARFEPATGEATVSGIFVEIGLNGLAERISPIRIGGVLDPAVPQF